ncbi:MAG: S-adenosylmethionine synthase [Candidatus Azambacteria bacterium GW2011_GWC2_45_7b]|uniref:S-adenosylmethionine synthase n=3 Tax=Parcubacteria group TaxID=1794811 RepID=A0A837IK60_9BACT|nr:MAG: S-adenosylmethionine synthase [Parcubacteria group bacterium GW2011_GWC1_44_10]KKT59929.1 MAG: S-adenosylmethionine synthase [Candidatus Giovannonibacteria bacterium GW2011_GWA1_44_25]KKU12927.1 MAG: S-adenosylmethionine synthase [Candidatus Azambacteria bacterium GW2011_GWC2_45_7b]KKU29756.1 MAG: S-adenosylmethionine synthase [Candidatus Giovannonibacteria bacterium GW2011_GWB1_46_20]
MSTMRYFLTSESVTEGHPDKLADQISDGVLDEILRQDPYARVAVESLLTTGQVVVAGEVTTKAYIDVQNIVRGVLKEAGYVKSEYGIDGDSCGVLVSLHEQSPDIALGVSGYRKERPEAVGAGDQGMMFGYASDETPELMPAPIAFAHRVTRRLAQARKSGEIKYLRPDGKSQVTVEYENGSVKRIHTVLVSAQHAPGVSIAKMKRDIVKKIIKKVLPKKLIDSKTKFLVNPTGRFVIGGPAGDTGLTGRKIIVDTYGGAGAHGGGAFSGKDPTKVDRSASYYARYVAKNIVAAGLAKKVEVKVAYAIGVPEPLMVDVDDFGTSDVGREKLVRIVKKIFDFRPGMIIKELRLRRPIYKQTAAYGHFGRTDLDLPWERINKAAALRRYVS